MKTEAAGAGHVRVEARDCRAASRLRGSVSPPLLSPGPSLPSCGDREEGL